MHKVKYQTFQSMHKVKYQTFQCMHKVKCDLGIYQGHNHKLPKRMKQNFETIKQRLTNFNYFKILWQEPPLPGLISKTQLQKMAYILSYDSIVKQ